MNFSDFIEKIKQEVSDILGNGFSINSRKVIKNNSVEYVCLVITEGEERISPGIYLNSFFLEHLNGCSVPELAQQIVMLYHKHDEFGKEGLYELINRDDISDRIFARLVNFERNEETLKDIPYERVQDLAITYHYLLSDGPEGISSIKMDYANCRFFKIDP